jgi:hypothetical protein
MCLLSKKDGKSEVNNALQEENLLSLLHPGYDGRVDVKAGVIENPSDKEVIAKYVYE